MHDAPPIAGRFRFCGSKLLPTSLRLSRLYADREAITRG